MKEQKHKNYLNKISKEGFLALQNGNSPIALEKFEIILSNYPNNSKILNLTSICYCNLNNLKKAEEHISMAVASNPREIGFRVNWGNILLQMKKYVEAEKVYKNALKNGHILPKNYEGYSFHSYETQPLPTDSLKPEEILEYRDKSYKAYHTAKSFLNKIEKRFGKKAIDNIKEMTKIDLKRRILGHQK